MYGSSDLWAPSPVTIRPGGRQKKVASRRAEQLEMTPGEVAEIKCLVAAATPVDNAAIVSPSITQEGVRTPQLGQRTEHHEKGNKKRMNMVHSFGMRLG